MMWMSVIASSIRLVRFTFELNTITDIRSGLFLIRQIIADPFFVHLDNRPVKNLDVIQTLPPLTSPYKGEGLKDWILCESLAP